jgi:streptogramin lyase
MDDYDRASLLRMTPQGKYAELAVPEGVPAYFMIMGRDGNIWFMLSDASGTKIGRLHIPM